MLAYELYHLASHGVDFYGEGDLFEGGGLLEGLEIIRTPILSTPSARPARPDSCDRDDVWALLCECLAAKPDDRPSFASVASRMGDARQAAGGSAAKWLSG